MKSAIKVWRHQSNNYRFLGQTAKVISKTRIIEAPLGFKGPYWVVLVELTHSTSSGQVTKLVGQWSDIGEPKIGMKVTGVLRRIGETGKAEAIEYGVKWKRAR